MRSPGQRAGLTHGAVLAAARELLAEEGLDALSMRGLAGRLGVAPNALYSHVGNKTMLIDDLLDHALAAVEAPATGVVPESGMRQIMTSTYTVLLDHADLVPLYLARQGARGPHARRLGDIMIGLLNEAGVYGPAAGEALRVLIVYTIGFAALATRPLMDSTEAGPLTTEELSSNFAAGLDWLLSGIVSRANR